MMKKLISILIVTLMVFCVSAKCYSIKCPKCVENCKKEHSNSYYINVAWRDWSVPQIKKDGKIFGLYRCYGGHECWVEL